MNDRPNLTAAFAAVAMLGAMASGPADHGMTRMGKPSRFNLPKSIPRVEREKRKAKKKQAVASKRRNRK